MERIGNKVSYIRKPLAKRSLVAAGLLLTALAFFAAAVGYGYSTSGNAPLFAAALGLCSIVTGGSALGYAIGAFFEREKNYLLAKVCGTAAGVLLLVWALVIVIAL